MRTQGHAGNGKRTVPEPDDVCVEPRLVLRVAHLITNKSGHCFSGGYLS